MGVDAAVRLEAGMTIPYEDREMTITENMIATGSFECVVCGDPTDTVLFMNDEFWWICDFGHESKVGFGRRE